MSNSPDLDARLASLRDELEGPPGLPGRVLQAAAASPPTKRSVRGRLRRLAVPAAAAGLVLAAAVWMAQPRSLYAQAVSALRAVDTVHVTGWTSRVVRKWPLEDATAEPPARRYAVDAWYWTDGGQSRSHQAVGPVVLTEAGDTLTEYQKDADLTFISKGRGEDPVLECTSLAGYLESLKTEGVPAESLGERTVDGRRQTGVRLRHDDGEEEFWFDAETRLPAEFGFRSGADAPDDGFRVTFAYDQPVPAAVSSYVPPETTQVRYGGRHEDALAAWERHVQDLGREADARGGSPTIVPRAGDRRYVVHQRITKTPGGRHLVVPLDVDQHRRMSVKGFLDSRVTRRGGDRAPEMFRVEDGLLYVEFERADLVCDAETPWREWTAAALETLGLELAEEQVERTVWIARHDGRELPAWRTVRPPKPYVVEGGVEKKGVVRTGVGHRLKPVTMRTLFRDFNRQQNSQYEGVSPIIVDETGLPAPPPWKRSEHGTWREYAEAVDYDQYLVATDSPYFAGDGSTEMARQWFAEKFGITFTEETRTSTVYVVRKKP